jgi:hypothetical protein
MRLEREYKLLIWRNKMTQAEKLGQKIVELFELPKLRQQSKEYGKSYYQTSWGNKTLEGIGNCVFTLVDENESNID